MANINLLPWREELRQEKQRQFMSILLLTAIFGIVFMYAVYSFFDSKTGSQRNRNSYLQEEIRKLDSDIKEIEALEKERQELVDRMDLIQNLQKSRPQVVHLFDSIVKAVPEGVNLSSITRVENKLSFEGIAESSPRVSNFLRNVETSEWIKGIDVKTLEGDTDSGANRKKFVAEAQVDAPSKKGEVKP